MDGIKNFIMHHDYCIRDIERILCVKILKGELAPDATIEDIKPTLIKQSKELALLTLESTIQTQINYNNELQMYEVEMSFDIDQLMLRKNLKSK